MLGLTIKALLFVWPFLKRAIFGDRTIKEVLLENKHVTAMLILVVILLGTLFIVTSELKSVKARNWAVKAEMDRLKKMTPEKAEMLERRRRLNDLLK
ncbi:hypothetical protein RVBP20_1940 [Pseudomonas phage sp. NK1]|nr:hypothetical protein RVBP20_1940 [Pseudomonas phage sp. NK1]